MDWKYCKSRSETGRAHTQAVAACFTTGSYILKISKPAAITMNKSASPDFLSQLESEHLSLWNSKSEPLQTVQLPESCIVELAAAAEQTTDDNFNTVARLNLQHCDALVERARSVLQTGSGCVLIDRFPVEKYDTALCRRAAGILSHLISPIMPQDTKGTLLYDVVDTGARESISTRRSKTNHEQPFHTDGPWLPTPPGMIGLFCLNPSPEGGYSQVASLQNAIQNIVEQAPACSSLLQQNIAWNCMGQHDDGAAPFNSLPVVDARQSGALVMRYYADYVRTGHTLSDDEIDPEIDGLLQDLNQHLVANACEPFRLETGQIIYINNWSVTHARAKFKDESSQTGRHLVRLWGR